MLRTIYNLENLDDAALARTVDDVRRQHDIQIYLVARDGSDLLGRKVPAAVSRIAQQLRERRRKLSSVTAATPGCPPNLSPGRGEVSAVFVFPSHRSVMLNVLGGNLWLRHCARRADQRRRVFRSVKANDQATQGIATGVPAPGERRPGYALAGA